VLLHHIVEHAASAAPGTTLLVADEGRWSARSFNELVARLGSGIAAHVEPGERVAIIADNRAEFAAALYAVPRAGAVLVMGNTRHTETELAELLNSTGAAAVIATGPHLDRLLPLAEQLPTVRTWWNLDDEARPGAGPVAELVAHDVVPPVARDERDVAWLIPTSGTTGRAKGALLTHRSLVAAALNAAVGRPVTDDDVYLFPFPLFHVAAYNVLQLHLRRRTVVLAPKFDAVDVMRTIEREGVTMMSLAPTMLAMMLDHPERARCDLSSLRQISYGASAMPLDLLRRSLHDLPAVGLAQGYGMTELSGNAVFLGPEEHRRAASDRPELLRAAGRPGPLVELRIADDDGRALATGTDGEILVRGDQVTVGYWNQPEADAAAFHLDEDGTRWLRTGDIGRIDDDGYLYVVDRKKDIIITGGENVASREVEDVLSEHPHVAGVAVVGVPDATWGEAVCTVVVWRGDVAARAEVGATVDGLIEWSRDRLAGFKRPRRVVEVDELPVNASGKIDKRALRELLDRFH
jgi:acyl-CoA synthetase (AMP-forming)/AMP-acid ligase II